MANDLMDLKFKALADNTRREILLYLKNGTHYAGEIARQFSITAPSISYHLTVLTKSRLISSYRCRGYIFYKLNLTELNEVFTWLVKFQSDEKEV